MTMVIIQYDDNGFFCLLFLLIKQAWWHMKNQRCSVQDPCLDVSLLPWGEQTLEGNILITCSSENRFWFTFRHHPIWSTCPQRLVIRNSKQHLFHTCATIPIERCATIPSKHHDKPTIWLGSNMLVSHGVSCRIGLRDILQETPRFNSKFQIILVNTCKYHG